MEQVSVQDEIHLQTIHNKHTPTSANHWQDGHKDNQRKRRQEALEEALEYRTQTHNVRNPSEPRVTRQLLQCSQTGYKGHRNSPEHNKQNSESFDEQTPHEALIARQTQIWPVHVTRLGCALHLLTIKKK